MSHFLPHECIKRLFWLFLNMANMFGSMPLCNVVGLDSFEANKCMPELRRSYVTDFPLTALPPGVTRLQPLKMHWNILYKKLPLYTEMSKCGTEQLNAPYHQGMDDQLIHLRASVSYNCVQIMARHSATEQRSAFSLFIHKWRRAEFEKKNIQVAKLPKREV